ncbi:MAG TPA: MHYT domain-containing protein [Gemmatimonadaceae bacterium]|nr:MHYT domain-containing protein [Gemmatimonadaceae bacterium]
MNGTHDPRFVALSLIIAALASYAALDLAGRVRSAEGSTRLGWLAGGATVMGIGIWSMHFVAMLAFQLPVPIGYHLPYLLLSVAVAIGASLLALVVVSRAELSATALVAGGILMGSAIAGMHYIGMASMRVGAGLTYSMPVVLLSIAIAILASLAALALAFSFRADVSARGRLLKSLSAVVMGGAISGMHYTAMAGAHFMPGGTTVHHDSYVLATGALGAAIVAGALLMLLLALVGAVIDRNMQAKVQFARQLTDHAMELAGQVEESRRLSARLEVTNAHLQRSLEDAHHARTALAVEQQTTLELQRVAALETAKARWLEGVAETSTALAHEVNNPLTALLMNIELLAETRCDQTAEPVAEIQASAKRIADVINRLANTAAPRSVPYIGALRMIDLAPVDPDQPQ